MVHTSVLASTSLFLRSVHPGQTVYFQQAVIGGKTCAGYLLKLADESFDSIGGSNPPAKLPREFEASAQIWSVILPRLRNPGAFLAPPFGKDTQGDWDRVLRSFNESFTVFLKPFE